MEEKQNNDTYDLNELSRLVQEHDEKIEIRKEQLWQVITAMPLLSTEERYRRYLYLSKAIDAGHYFVIPVKESPAVSIPSPLIYLAEKEKRRQKRLFWRSVRERLKEFCYGLLFVLFGLAVIFAPMIIDWLKGWRH